jgi:adenosylmethionine-8-amino-7-oxononanoate aminotransferase
MTALTRDKMGNTDWALRDVKVLWHPCSQMKDYESMPIVPIRSGKGVWLEDFEGNRYLDAISSWWVNLFGHSHPYINQAITSQLDQLEHIIFAGFTHEPAVRLAERLIHLTKGHLNRCFYADNGSSAVEVALKMSFHFWLNSGQPQKKKFITLSNSYHGETLGALALGDVSLYKQTYGPLLMTPIVVPSPDCFSREEGVTWEDHTRQMFSEMEQALARHAHETAAVILEPLVQCAGGMRMFHPIYLTLLREACDRYNVHLIADEIAVGFGRTGTMFACEQADIYPDFLCLSKGITGGYLPLSCVLTTATVYEAFYDDYVKGKAFLHSHSYTGNALACRAALATLELFETENTLISNKSLSSFMGKKALPLQDHPHVVEVRQTGMIVAVEMIQDKKKGLPYPSEERRGLRVYRHGLGRGVILRPLGNVIYFMPPYVINEEEIVFMIDVALEGIDIATLD